jgi:hypothetical protein
MMVMVINDIGFDISLAKKDIGKIVEGHADQHHTLGKGHSLQLLFHIPRFDDADSEVCVMCHPNSIVVNTPNTTHHSQRLMSV